MPDPTSALTPPQAQEPIPDLVTKILGASSYVSPSYWAGWAAQQAFGMDPWSWVAQQYAGDWEAAGEAGGAIRSLSTFNQLHADEILQSLHWVTRDHPGDLYVPWSGQAADAARAYHERLAGAIAAQSGALDELAGNFQTMADGVKLATDGLTGAFRMATDYALAAAVTAAAAVASGPTVIGPIVGSGATAALIAKAAYSFSQVMSYHDAVVAMLHLFASHVALTLAGVDTCVDLPLPSSSYDHPDF